MRKSSLKVKLFCVFANDNWIQTYSNYKVLLSIWRCTCGYHAIPLDHRRNSFKASSHRITLYIRSGLFITLSDNVKWNLGDKAWINEAGLRQVAAFDLADRWSHTICYSILILGIVFAQLSWLRFVKPESQVLESTLHCKFPQGTFYVRKNDAGWSIFLNGHAMQHDILQKYDAWQKIYSTFHTKELFFHDFKIWCIFPVSQVFVSGFLHLFLAPVREIPKFYLVTHVWSCRERERESERDRERKRERAAHILRTDKGKQKSANSQSALFLNVWIVCPDLFWMWSRELIRPRGQLKALNLKILTLSEFASLPLCAPCCFLLFCLFFSIFLAHLLFRSFFIVPAVKQNRILPCSLLTAINSKLFAFFQVCVNLLQLSNLSSPSRPCTHRDLYTGHNCRWIYSLGR